MSDERTIIVTGYFGKDKEITKEYFVNSWLEHTAQLKCIDYSEEWCNYVNEVNQKVIKKAGEIFEEKFKQQNEEK